MAKNNGSKTVEEALMKSAETQALMKNALKDESFILDGDAILSSVLGGQDEGATLEKVVKLVGSETNPNPGITGTFLGFEAVLVRRPGADAEDDKQLMNFVLIEVRQGFIAKLLGTSQVMQGLASTKIGASISIIRPGTMRDGKWEAEFTSIGGAKRVGIFHVINRGTKRGGSATPFGEVGKHLAAMNAAKALPADASSRDPEVTGEV